MPVQYPEQVATFEEFGSPCVCGAENFERVVVERVLSRPVVTDLIACVECRCVYYSPLPKPAAAPKPAKDGESETAPEAPIRRPNFPPDQPTVVVKG